MSWIQKLCEVYDAIIGTPDCDMLSVGFINKNIELNIILSAKGEFVTAERLNGCRKMIGTAPCRAPSPQKRAREAQ